MLLFDSHVVISCTDTGLSPSMDPPFQASSPSMTYTKDCQPHLPLFRFGIRLVLIRVHSPLLTESQLISFPPPTKMLQFGGFPIANATVSEETGSPIQPSADLRHTCAYPQLIAACHDLHRHSSRAIPQLGCSITCMLPHHASNPSVSNSCQFGFLKRPTPLGWSFSALPPT